MASLKSYNLVRPDGTKFSMRLDDNDVRRYEKAGWAIESAPKPAAKAQRAGDK